MLSGLLTFLGGCSKSAETSVEMDSVKIRVLLGALGQKVTSGLAEAQIAEVENDFSALQRDGTKERTYPVVFKGESSELRIQIRKEDVDAVELHFQGEPALVEEIQNTIRATPLDAI